jgi:drug/metabolite transporter (DMT)-like permease
MLLGALLWLGQTFQILGLDRTSEAVSAFLTSLTVVFVPMIMLGILRRPPAPSMWVAVLLATCGVWLMTGAAPTGFGAGEWLGLGCSLVFAVHMILLGKFGAQEASAHLAVGQFFSVGLGAALLCVALTDPLDSLTPAMQWHLAIDTDIWQHVLLLVSISTLLAFGCMFHFQPRLDPTRAALLYLCEPVFAALFAYLTIGRELSLIALGGAALLLAANGLVEVWARR